MNKYLTSLFRFSKYFTSNYDKNFIGHFKEVILNQFNNKIDKKNEILYPGSSSLLYFPKKNIIKNNQKNILLITHELSRTGAPIVVLDAAKILIKHGFFVTVISPLFGPLIESFIHEEIPVIVSEELYYLQYRQVSSSNFIDKLDLDLFVNNFDTILFNTATLFNFVKRYMFLNKKMIWWIHEGSETYKGIGDIMPKYLSSNIEVYCVGQYAINQLEKNGFHYYPKNLVYGVSKISKKTKIKKFSSKEKIKFLSVGTFNKRKGQDILLEAIKSLPQKYLKQAEFIFIGDSTKDFDSEQIKKYLIESEKKYNNIKLFSSLKREELFKIYENIDVLVVPSIDDPMPVVATENFMLGNICLCSKNTGTATFIQDKKNGFVFESENIDELKEKIMYILDNLDELDQVKKNGEKIYKEYFEMDIFEKNILKIVKGEE